ncbi:hypothetical protein NO2_0934 [Candidatus Termititenax persephonae]|uniref:FkbM family methyltransferase n=1 Tax=Candidatus Termititenax persephonae TaxID=2218525 RepID=A0A388TGX7_9BACT|nr:hypothetical protein NO2_0934 [Candidatus Termititenax persephonae]
MSKLLTNEFLKLKDAKFVLYGAGYSGKSCHAYLKRLGLAERVFCFIDSDTAKHGNFLAGKEICALSILEGHPDMVVIISSMCYESILQNIVKAEFPNEVYAFIECQPFFAGRFDIGNIESQYENVDYVNNITSIIVAEEKNNCLIQPIRNVIDFSGNGDYWYGKAAPRLEHNELTICDAGAYTGDTLQLLYGAYGSKIKRYYAFEPDNKSRAGLEQKIRDLNLTGRAAAYDYGLGNVNGKAYFAESDIDSSFFYNNTTQHNTTQHNTTQHNTTQHNTTQHNNIPVSCRC